MKILPVVLLIALWSGIAHAGVLSATVKATFNPAPEVGEQVCVLASDTPGIVQSYTSGVLSAFGQCTMEPGQSSVVIGNIAPGKTWYFIAASRNAETHELTMAPGTEVSLTVPANILEIVSLPTISTDGNTVNITVELQ